MKFGHWRDPKKKRGEPTGKGFVLQIMDPAFLADQDMHKLLPNGWMAESCDLLVVEVIRDGCDMAQ
jgi:hypothetical protein